MHDVFTALLSHGMSQKTTRELEGYRDVLSSAQIGINAALEVIGSLIPDEHSPDAGRDLAQVGRVLRYLPPVRFGSGAKQHTGTNRIEPQKGRGSDE